MEEIRMKYYGQLKRFLAIPNNFRGVSEMNNFMFPAIIERQVPQRK
jgi:dynein heavy chain 2